MERVLIIVPTYNERENLAALVGAALAELPGADVLVIDDGSPDGTGVLADALAAENPHVKVLHRAGKLGLGTAYLAGFRYALAHEYDFVFEMDADFSHDPKYLPLLWRRAREGADVVVGSRYVAGGGTINWGIGRQIISRGGSLYARTILGVGVRDLTSGFICYRRAVLEGIALDHIRSNGYSFQIEMKYRALKAGFRLVEVPIVFVDRRVGASKMSRAIVVEALTRVWKLRWGA
ncbi:MAG TPA: polyprenol monophosphomannose synthase [Polyangia bacterium]|jgi:dolichol-phosphate mannosyltransferase|nr:polyprenol monophosphomannose synthase [Polyangia bacterium]